MTCYRRFVIGTSWWRAKRILGDGHTVEAQSCGPWNQRLSNYQNKSCKSYAFSLNCLRGKCANLNHSNIDIVVVKGPRRLSLSLDADKSLIFETCEQHSNRHSPSQVQVNKHIGKMAWPKTGLIKPKSSPAETLEKMGQPIHPHIGEYNTFLWSG